MRSSLVDDILTERTLWTMYASATMTNVKSERALSFNHSDCS